MATTADPRAGATLRTLRVDRVACSAHGVCASLLPEHVRLDEWGYPIVTEPALDEQDARLAVTLCPARALWVASAVRPR